ncbi:MAG: hypothetical protein Q4E03_03680 [Trueperella sp.]|nr:hypothetical protein [Trueperella sp.]
MEKPEENNSERDLSAEELPSAAQLRDKNRRLIVLAIMLGLFLATVGFIAGKNMRAEREANQNPDAAVVVVVSAEGTADVL